ncbi:MAG: alanine dehydrogenase, partial [Calditrichaeota bacterium]
MKIGIVKETKIEERRVPITPAGVYALAREGHQIFVEDGAGQAAGFADEAYLVVGAKHADDAKEVYEKADIIVKVMPPEEKDVQLLRERQILFSFFQL